jgi:pimeloyl-ACP methyl ester carboxylesterase
MKTILLYLALCILFAAALPAQDVTGDWHGTLKSSGPEFRIAIHISKGDNGSLQGTFDSLDQGAKGVPLTSVTLDGANFKFTIAVANVTYVGKINADTISGTWSQAQSLPLEFKRGPFETSSSARDSAPRGRQRPQNPVKPYPYKEEEVGYDNLAQRVHLAATITIPPGSGPFPAVLLITGSGPQDRDETLPFQHRPFLVLADYLTRHGIVVLRADDRGVGKSSGDFATATTADFATDTEAGLAYLKNRPEVNVHKLGLIGHSEGGIIAPMVAARNPDVSFIVMMAGTGVRGDEVLPAQAAAILEAGGKTHEEAEKTAAQNRELLLFSEHEKDDALLGKKIQELAGGQLNDAQVAAQVKQIRSPWFQYFLQYDPATALRKVKCPVLAINGEKDRQVPPAQNLPAIRKALEEGGNTHFEVDELAGLNHLLQTAKTGSPMEYAEIEETMSPVALDKISAWILKQ